MVTVNHPTGLICLGARLTEMSKSFTKGERGTALHKTAILCTSLSTLEHGDPPYRPGSLHVQTLDGHPQEGASVGNQ
ncbi:hypothetical protein LIER_32854 [Lithospermum erythrorhizon]|uniref:Uncharacterized protein n=1 Tax=Lithospermum erythrorhizon TaxID=34254 RepID=A0AAV3S0B6_LITER